MNVAPLASMPMPGWPAGAAAAGAGAGFGDLLSALGALGADEGMVSPLATAALLEAGETAAGSEPEALPAAIPSLNRDADADSASVADPASLPVSAEAPDADATTAAGPTAVQAEADPLPTSQPAPAKGDAEAPLNHPRTASNPTKPAQAMTVAPTQAVDAAAALPRSEAPAAEIAQQTDADRPAVKDAPVPIPAAVARPAKPAKGELPASEAVDVVAMTDKDAAPVERPARREARDKGEAKADTRIDTATRGPADAAPQPLPLVTAPAADQRVPAVAAEQANVGTDAGQPLAAAPAPAIPADPRHADAAAPQPGQDNLPALLASQTPAASIARTGPAVQPYATAPHVPAQPVIPAQTGRIGRDMGVEIARQVSAGRQEVLVRLDPAEMGRVDVRLSFDDNGRLHATMSADSAVALDMLRRDAGDLSRALADAGIRTDASSFRFDSRGGGDAGQFAQNQQNGGQRGDARDHHGGSRHGRRDDDLAIPYRQLRTSGRVDLTA